MEHVIPLAMRRRYIASRIVNAQTGVTVTTSFPCAELLPGDYQARYWAIAELRCYRSANATPGSAMQIIELRAGGGMPIFRSTPTFTGLGLLGQEGTVPVNWPLPEGWGGTLDLDQQTDIASGNATFRLHVSLIELTRAEWEALDRGGLTCCDDTPSEVPCHPSPK